MKTDVFQFHSGFWGVRILLPEGWTLWSVSDPTKEAAITQSRMASMYCPSGRLYKLAHKQEATRRQRHE